MRLKNLVLAVVASITLSSVVEALPLSSIRSAVRSRLRDTAADVSYQRYSDATIDEFINEGQRDFVSKTLLMSGTTVFGLTSGTIEYDLPADYLSSIRVTISSRVLEQVSIGGLDSNSSDWTIATSTPTRYYVTPHSSATSYRIGFIAKPSVTTTGSVRMFYYQQATDLSSDTDVPFGGRYQYVPYHPALIDYASAIGWLVQGRMDLAKPFFDLYGGQIEIAKRNLGFMPDFNPAMTGSRTGK